MPDPEVTELPTLVRPTEPGKVMPIGSMVTIPLRATILTKMSSAPLAKRSYRWAAEPEFRRSAAAAIAPGRADLSVVTSSVCGMRFTWKRVPATP